MQNKKFRAPKVIIIAVLVGLVGASLWFLYGGQKNVTVKIISGAGGMPPAISEGSPLKEEATVVFTEPFINLNQWREAEIIQSKTTALGQVEFQLEPGKYGLYLDYDGSQVLYSNLEVDGALPAQKIQNRGYWFVEVNGLKNEFIFSVNQLGS